MEGMDQFFVELASVLNLSAEFVRENSREAILEYARYVMLRNVVINLLFFSSLVAGILGVVYILEISDRDRQEKIAFLKKGTWIVGLMTIVPTIAFTIPYFISPYLYGVEKLMNLIK